MKVLHQPGTDMPTIKPRLAIILDPNRHELIKRLAKLQGVSASSLVADLVETVAPVLERVCVAIESAQAASASVKTNLRRVSLEAEAAMMPHALAAMDQFDMFIQDFQDAGKQAAPDDLVHEGRASGRRAPGRPEGPETPRPVITGGRSTKPKRSQSVASPAPERVSKKKGVGG